MNLILNRVRASEGEDIECVGARLIPLNSLGPQKIRWKKFSQIVEPWFQLYLQQGREDKRQKAKGKMARLLEKGITI